MGVIQNISQHMVNISGGVRYIGDIDHIYKPFFYYYNRIPVTRVRISDFKLCDHPVTEAEWDAVMGGHSVSLLPKVNVSWFDAINFIQELNRQTGLKYRLPTEAEWEFAARGGARNRANYLFAGSRILMEVGWYKVNSKSSRRPVMQLLPNQLGLYDMSGNVGEWCSDWYYSDYAHGASHLFDDDDPVLDPHGPSIGKERVLRGGSFGNDEKHCWIFWREKEKPEKVFNSVGFRLAMTA